VLNLDRHRHRHRHRHLDASSRGNSSESAPFASSLLSRDEAITLLDTVHILPVYDFPSAVQAINQVSDALHEIHRERHHPRRQGQNEAKDEKGVVEEEEEPEPEPEPILLIIEGLDSLTESIIRTSNPLRGSAVLMPVLRTLTHLSRTYASFLSVVIVNNTLGLGGGGSVSSSVSSLHTHTTANHASDGNRPTTSSDDGGLYSIFFRSTTGSGSGSGSGSLLPTLLSRTLDQGIDIHLMLSFVKGRPVVEVIKDRVGGNVGRWCVWE
jgi:hypothetical protein